MNTEIEAIRSWAELINFLLKNAKIKAMMIGSSRYLSAMQLESMSDIRVGNEAFPLSKFINYLSMIITNTLNWNEHVTK